MANQHPDLVFHLLILHQEYFSQRRLFGLHFRDTFRLSPIGNNNLQRGIESENTR
jgi:hypothetical protein